MVIDFFGTVEEENAANTAVSDYTPADDAQAAEEVSAEELFANLTGEGGAQTAENGDGDQSAQTQQEQESNQQQVENDKFSRRISAALRSQKEQIYRELGMSEADVRELIRAHKAEQMHKEDPEISVKAAGEILKARESAAPKENPRAEQMRAQIRTLVEDGWTSEMLQAFTTDKTVIEQIEDGKTIRQAAMAYLSRGQKTENQNRRAVPTIRTATASASPDEDRIANMSDAEFDRFARSAMDAAYSGKKVTFR